MKRCEYFLKNLKKVLLVFETDPGVRPLSVLSDRLGVDILILCGGSDSPAVALSSQDTLDELHDVYLDYDTVILSGETLAQKTLYKDMVLSCTVHMKTFLSDVVLQEELKNNGFSNFRFKCRTKNDVEIAFHDLDLSPDKYALLIKKLCKVGKITSDDPVTHRSFLYSRNSKRSGMFVTMNGIEFSITEPPSYFEKEMWYGGVTVIKRVKNFLSNYFPWEDIDVKEVVTLQELQEKLKVYGADGKLLPIAMDIETSGLTPDSCYTLDNSVPSGIGGRALFDPGDPNHKKVGILSVAVSSEDGEAFTFLVNHPRLRNYDPKEGEAMLHWVVSLDNPKVLHNAVFDVKMIEKCCGVNVNGKIIDTMLGEHILHEDMPSYKLESLISYRLEDLPRKSSFHEKAELSSSTSRFPAGKTVTDSQVQELAEMAKHSYTEPRNMDFSLLDRDDLVKYNGEDAGYTLRAYYSQMKELKDSGMGERDCPYLTELLHRIVSVSSFMEQNGVPVNVDLAKDLIKKCDTAMGRYLIALQGVFGSDVCPDSSKKLAAKISQKFPDFLKKLPVTSSGDPELSKESLGPFATEHPWICDLMGYREAGKVRNTYLIPILKKSRGGRFYFDILLPGTTSGRLANFAHTLPGDLGELSPKLCLEPENGCSMIELDFSGAELYMLGNVSDDERYIKLLREGGDIHAQTAAALFGVDYNEMINALGSNPSCSDERQAELKKLRKNAKAANFGIIYGISAPGLAKNIGSSVSEAERLISQYYEKFPGIRAFLEKAEKDAIAQGYVQTFIGRRRRFPAIGYAPAPRVKKMVRVAKNFMVQSAMSDFFQFLIYEFLNVLGITLHLSVHDSILFSLDERVLPFCKLADLLQKALIEKPRLLWPELMKVDMRYSIKVGDSYGNLKVVFS